MIVNGPFFYSKLFEAGIKPHHKMSEVLEKFGAVFGEFYAEWRQTKVQVDTAVIFEKYLTIFILDELHSGGVVPIFSVIGNMDDYVHQYVTHMEDQMHLLSHIGADLENMKNSMAEQKIAKQDDPDYQE